MFAEISVKTYFAQTISSQVLAKMGTEIPLYLCVKCPLLLFDFSQSCNDLTNFSKTPSH
jgi:hypothetical protein